MTKTLKILLVLALALTLVFSLAACGEKEENKDSGKGETVVEDGNDVKEPVEEPDVEEASATAEDTLDAFLSAACEFRFVDVGAYTVNPESYAEAMFGGSDIPSDVNSIDEVIDALMESLGGDEIVSLLGADFEDFMKNTFKDMLGRISYTYELKEEVSEDEVIYSIVFSMPDFEAVGEIIGNAFNDPAVTDAMMEMVESGEITEDMSEEDMMAAIMPLVIDVIDDVVTDALGSGDTIETETEATLVKIDGKWLIQD